jgi:hypothetical protein
MIWIKAAAVPFRMTRSAWAELVFAQVPACIVASAMSTVRYGVGHESPQGASPNAYLELPRDVKELGRDLGRSEGPRGRATDPAGVLTGSRASFLGVTA